MANVGRPRGDNNKDYNYTIRMDETTKNQLETYCEKMGVPKSTAIRKAIWLLSGETEAERAGK